MRGSKHILIIFSLGSFLLMTCSQDFLSNLPCTNQLECPKNYKCENGKCVPCNPQECPNGYFIQPGFQVLASSLDFEDVQVKTTKVKSVDIKYTAISGASINIKGVIELDNKDKNGTDVFRVVNDKYQELKPNSILPFQVTYSPKNITTNSAYLVISSNEPGNPYTKVKLTGRGVDPNIEVSPSSIDFGSNFKDGPEKVEEVKISNTGSGPLEIISISLSEGSPKDFSLKNTPTPGAKIQPSGSLTFKVVFTPKTPGTLTSTVIIKNADIEKEEIHITVRAYVSDQCEPGYFDMNKDPADGCECLQDKRGGNSCDQGEAKPVIDGENLPDTGGCVTVTGNLVPEDAEDWWTFVGVDTPDVQGNATEGGDKYKISIKFLSNPDQLVFDVYKGCLSKDGRYLDYCSGSECIPKKEDRKRNLEDGYNQKCNQLTFDMSKNTTIDGEKFPRGQEVCQLPQNTPQKINMNYCEDDTARYYIRVYRNKDSSGGIPVSKASCEKYVLQICNGN